MKTALTAMTLGLTLILGANRANSASVTLYDGSLSGTPDSQGWLEFATAPASVTIGPIAPIGFITVDLPQATQTQISGGTRLNTAVTNALITDPNDIAGGYSNYESCIDIFPNSCTPNLINSSFPTLDRNAGYSISLDLKINSENHVSNNLAGFSIITISSDLRGIELGFWEDEIWAQQDDVTGSLFTHAEGNSAIATTASSSYELQILGESYQLFQNNSLILSGPLRDYSAFDHTAGISLGGVNLTLPYDPYETPNLLAFGDSTTRGSVNADLEKIAVTTAEATNNNLSTGAGAPFEFSPTLGVLIMAIGAIIDILRNNNK